MKMLEIIGGVIFWLTLAFIFALPFGFFIYALFF